jgi:hypothetical protein
MAIGLSEAADATGVNRSTIYRAWKSGRLSAAKADTGQVEIEPAELFRVFPPAAQQGAHIAAHHGATDREVRQLCDALAAMREDRDAWRELARKEGDERRELAQRLVLAAPRPATAPESAALADLAGRLEALAAERSRTWWRWAVIRGRAA